MLWAGMGDGVAHLAQQVLVQAVTRQKHLALILATLKLKVLALPPQQPCLLLRLALLELLLLPQKPLGLLPLGGAGVLLELLGKTVGRAGGQGASPSTAPPPPTAAARAHLLQLLLPQFVCSLLSLQQGGQLLLLLPEDVLLELTLLGLGCSGLLLTDGLVPPGQLFCLSPKASALGLELPLQPRAMLLPFTPQPRLQGQQLFLVLSSHPLIAAQLLPQRRVLLVLLDLAADLGQEGE